MICWKCHEEIKAEKIFRTSECPLCHADLHCCRGCEFFCPGNHYDCRENVDFSVSEKEKSNFCDFFKIRNFSSEKIASNPEGDRISDARKALNSLFGENVSEIASSDKDSAIKNFNALFND